MEPFQKITSKEYILLSLLGAAILIPAFFQIGREPSTLFLIFLILGIAFYLKGVNLSLGGVPKIAFATFGALLLWAAVQSFFLSSVPYESLRIFFLLFASSAAFYLSYSTIKTQKALEFFSYIILAGSALLVYWGFQEFINSQHYSYLRMVSTFYHHNAFASFLLFPLFLSFWLLFKEKSRGNILIFAAIAGSITVFVLTFSRGGFIGFGAGLIIFLFGLWKCFDFSQFLKKVFILFLILAFGSIAAYALYLAKTKQAQNENIVAVSPYAAELEGESGFWARIEYMKLARNLFYEKPLTGYGLGSYATEARRVQTDSRFYSSNPHNEYLKFFAELGVWGGGLFVSFVVFVFFYFFRKLLFYSASLLYYAYGAGFLALAIHVGGDVDFYFFSILFLFFAAAGIILGFSSPQAQAVSALRNATRKKRLNDTPSPDGIKKSIFVLIVAIFGILAGMMGSVWLGEVFYKKSLVAYGQGESEKTRQNLEKARTFDPFNPAYMIYEANLAVERNDFDAAENMLAKAENTFANSRDIYLSKAMLAKKMEDKIAEEEALKRALAIAPYRDLVPVARLVELFLSQGRQEEVRSFIAAALERFPESAFNSSVWIDPRKPKIKEEVQRLKKIYETL